MARKLTDKQQAYVNLRLTGITPIDAYRQAYDSKKKNPNTMNVEAQKLERHPIIAPLLVKKRQEVAEKVLVTTADVVNGLLKEAKDEGDGTSQSARVSAWKAVGDYTGGFDSNKLQVEQKVVEMTHDQWMDSLE